MKRGIIKIGKTSYEKDWECIKQIFENFKIINIEFRHWENMWYYFGESELFDEVKEGNIIPEYDVIFTRQANGIFTYVFYRIIPITIRSIYDKHKIKLDILKENRGKSEEEKWSDIEVASCDSQIQSLASILSDLNKHFLQL